MPRPCEKHRPLGALILQRIGCWRPFLDARLRRLHVLRPELRCGVRLGVGLVPPPLGCEHLTQTPNLSISPVLNVVCLDLAIMSQVLLAKRNATDITGRGFLAAASHAQPWGYRRAGVKAMPGLTFRTD